MADKILELKVGSVDVADIDEYNTLKNKLSFWRKRLDVATSTTFQNVEYFYVGERHDGSESRNQFILANNRSEEDKFLKQAVIDTLTMKIIEQINDKIKKINKLVK